MKLISSFSKKKKNKQQRSTWIVVVVVVVIVVVFCQAGTVNWERNPCWEDCSGPRPVTAGPHTGLNHCPGVRSAVGRPDAS